MKAYTVAYQHSRYSRYCVFLFYIYVYLYNLLSSFFPVGVSRFQHLYNDGVHIKYESTACMCVHVCVCECASAVRIHVYVQSIYIYNCMSIGITTIVEQLIEDYAE